MKTYTRKSFEKVAPHLKALRRNDPYQFDVLYREYCRQHGVTPTSSR
jgi:hypothetical protein